MTQAAENSTDLLAPKHGPIARVLIVDDESAACKLLAILLTEAAELILTHHERHDGIGYLSDLKADQIPIGARIFAFADTLDAITSDRSYCSAQSFEEAFKIIRKGSGRVYDPQAVEAFFTIPSDTWPAIGRSICD